MKALRGRVVLVDFWTYSCINCIRTLPHTTQLYETYKDQGLVVIGVHTPEFTFEKSAENVTAAMQRYGIKYPVAQDNDYKTWSAFQNQFWPAIYLIDKDGNLAYTHFGEGNYDGIENSVRQLLSLPGGVAATQTDSLAKIQSPEMYFGSSRSGVHNISEVNIEQANTLKIPAIFPLNRYALQGMWKISTDKATLSKAPGKLKLRFHAGKVFLVASSRRPITVTVKVDGQEINKVKIQASDIYTLYNTEDYGPHVLELEIPQAGLEIYTFTFG
jgi:peroxiredoxin